MHALARMIGSLIAVVLLALAVAPASFSPRAQVAQAQVCDPAVVVPDILSSIQVSGSTATGTFVNVSTDCTVKVGIASYRMFDNVIANQVVFDWKTAMIGPGETLTLTVQIPDCRSQIDTFYGDVLLTAPFYGGQGRLIDAVFTEGEFCDRQECTLTQGFWKTHPEAWPTLNLTLGGVSYTQEQLLAILNQPVQGNGLISLAHQLIAAKLNLEQGASGGSVSTSIAQADTLIGALVVPPVGSGYLNPADTSSLTAALDNFNKGTTGPGHCEDD
jgi:hypothetical protein